MEIKDRIEEFECRINHYPYCLKWKRKIGPILAYYKKQDYIRIDMFTKVPLIYDFSPKDKRFQVSTTIGNQTKVNGPFRTFEEAYAYLLEYAEKNKMRFLL